MVRFRASLVSICAILSTTTAAILSSSPTTPAPCDHQAAATTPAPAPPLQGELKKRTTTINSRICGYIGTDYFSCSTGYYCAATIFPNGDAYQYCSDPAFGSQVVFTTAVGNFNSASQSCDVTGGTRCCFGDYSATFKALFIAPPYTVTGFACWPTDTTVTYDPLTNVLYKPSFSASLAQAMSSTIVPSSTTPPSSTSTTTPSPSSSAAGGGGGGGGGGGSSSGLSSGAKIGIGAGVGVGVGLALLGGIAFFCWRRHQKKKQRVNEIAPSYAAYGQDASKSPPTPYSPPMSYNEAQPWQQGQPKYYTHEQASPPWSPQPPSSPGGYPTTPHYPAEVPYGGQPHELAGQPSMSNK